MWLGKGWFSIPGMQAGDRSVAEQKRGLDAALAEAKGKTVCDLGTAEGCIALDFAQAGAERVFGCDANPALLITANRLLARASSEVRSRVKFSNVDLNKATRERPWSYDIVLALAILHKLESPEEGTRFAARSAKSLLVVRLPKGSTGEFGSKHRPDQRCDLRKVMPSEGFVLERTEEGPRTEQVQYWRRR
jgi:tRNA G37 N-methylase Trm5